VPVAGSTFWHYSRFSAAMDVPSFLPWVRLPSNSLVAEARRPK